MDRPLDLPIYNNYTLNLPAWFATATKNYGNAKEPVWFALANPMTTSRNISNRKHEHSIDIARKSIAKPELVKNQWDNHFEFYGNAPYSVALPQDFKKDMTLEHFSKLDQTRIERMQQHPNKNFANYPVISRGRPEELPKNVEYNRHHGNHSKVQKYGVPYLEKVVATNMGRPIDDGEESAQHPSPSSSRTPTARSGSSSSGSKSRLSSLASSLRSSSHGSHGGFEPANDSEEDSDSESEDEREAERNRQRGLFGRNPLGSVSGSSKSGSSRPSVSRGKPPLKRPEPKPKTIAGTTAPKPKKTKPAVELVIEETDAEPPAPKPKRKTKTTKPTPSEAGEVITKKARGRTPKYATKAEAYQAKIEQNKIGKQKKAEAKRLAGTGIKKKIHGVDYVLEIDESAPVEHFSKKPATHIMPDGTVMLGATHPKEETQEERRFKFEEEQRKKHIEKLSANTEKLREKEEKRLAKVSAKVSADAEKLRVKEEKRLAKVSKAPKSAKEFNAYIAELLKKKEAPPPAELQKKKEAPPPAKKTRMKRVKDIVKKKFDDRVFYSNRFADYPEAYGIVDGKVMIIGEIGDRDSLDLFDDPKPVGKNVRFYNDDIPNKPIKKLNDLQEY